MSPTDHDSPDVGSPEDNSRIADAFASSEAVQVAQQWLDGDRPAQLKNLTRAVVLAYQSLENCSPVSHRFGSLHVDQLAPSNAMRATWPTTTLVLRHILLSASRLFRTLGVIVAGCGTDLTSSMPVVGRALQESVSLVDWATRPLAVDAGSPDAAHVVGRRCFLLETAGRADLLRESVDFQMPDLDKLDRVLDEARDRARAVFGESARLAKNDSRSWSIDGERIPGPTRRVEDTGAYLFSAGRSPATHYHGPSMSAHASLGASLGAHILIEHGDRSHHAFVLEPKAVEGWLWYYTVWYRFAATRCAYVHNWDSTELRSEDASARHLFGRAVTSSAR